MDVRWDIQIMTSQTRDTSLSADLQETGWGVLRNPIGNSNLGGTCQRT